MNGNEFPARLSRLARSRGVVVTIDTGRGKGSHVTVHFGDRRTTPKDRKKEIGKGLLAAMLKQLGLDQQEF